MAATAGHRCIRCSSAESPEESRIQVGHGRIRVREHRHAVRDDTVGRAQGIVAVTMQAVVRKMRHGLCDNG